MVVMKSSFHNKKGFTLMELLVTVILVAVLASYSVYYYNNTIDEGKLNAAKGKLAALGGAFERYKIEQGSITQCPTQGLLITESNMNASCGKTVLQHNNQTANRAFETFHCGYAEKHLGLDENFNFYFGCPEIDSKDCGDPGVGFTVYMKPKSKTSSDVYPTCAYFNPSIDKVVEVK